MALYMGYHVNVGLCQELFFSQTSTEGKKPLFVLCIIRHRMKSSLAD